MPEKFQVVVTDVIPEFAKVMGKIDFKNTFPHTLAALNILAYEYAVKWRGFTQGEPIPGTPRVINSRGDYTRSINVETTAEEVKSVYSQGPWTGWIESGHGEIDLKPGLLSGPKARMGVSGPYNIVAFRHGTPKTLSSNRPMPLNVFNLIKRETDKADQAASRRKATASIGRSLITGRIPVKRASGKIDQGQTYRWGYRLPSSAGGVRQVKQTSQGEYQWRTGKYTGMVRMQADTSRAKTSTYITFRVVSMKSDPASWIVPSIPAVPIRQAVIDAMKERTIEVLRSAMDMDLGK